MFVSDLETSVGQTDRSLEDWTTQSYVHGGHIQTKSNDG